MSGKTDSQIASCGGSAGSAVAATRALAPGVVSGLASGPTGSLTLAIRALGATSPGGPGIYLCPVWDTKAVDQRMACAQILIRVVTITEYQAGPRRQDAPQNVDCGTSSSKCVLS